MADLPKIGLDIGTTTIKAVELTPVGKGWKLLPAVLTPAVGEVTAGMAAADVGRVAATVSAMIKEGGIKSRKVVAALPEEQVSSHVVELPLLKDAEIGQALEWQVEQYIPIPKDQAVWSWEVVRRDEVGGGMEVLLVAAAKNLVETYRKIVEGAGLELLAVETELAAGVRSQLSETSPLAVVVDIGSGSTDIGVARAGQLIFSRTIPTAWQAFVRAVETTLEMDKTQAAQYVNTYGFAADQLEGKVAAAMLPVLAIIVTEIRKTIDFHISKHPGETAKLVVLSGGAAKVPEIVGVLAAQLGVETSIGDPLAKLDVDEQQKKAFAENAPLYAVAIGLAQRRI